MALNAFRVSGDLLHVIALCMILYRLFVKKNAQGESLYVLFLTSVLTVSRLQNILHSVVLTNLLFKIKSHTTGISLKTQHALLFVSVARYLDLFTTFWSVYNSFMKVFFISSSLFICFSIPCINQLKSTYRPDQDMAAVGSWHYVIVLILTFTLACLLTNGRSGIHAIEVCWTASILWEPLSLIPQALLYRRYRQVEGLTGASFLFLMGLYRLLYIANWIVRANTERQYKHHPLVYFGGGVQVLIASCALFWPDGTNEGDMLAVPILTQIFQFCREVYCGMIGLLLLFGLNFCDESKILNGYSAVLVRIAKILGLTLLALTPPACFYTMYRDMTRASAHNGDDHDEVLAALTLPLMETTEGAANDDSTILEQMPLPTKSQSDIENETPATPPNVADGMTNV